MEQNQQGGGQGRGRRGHFHRGRRPDRRQQSGQEQRPPRQQESQAPRGDSVDIEQIMRDIRARIAQRHGIDLSAQQISELAARRLEAILDPRNVDPSLLDQLRKAAGSRPLQDVASPSAEPAYNFEDTTLYETHRGLLRAIRKFLNPILRLFFNPNPIVHALNTQARLNAEQAAREGDRAQQQSEWNALHYELVKRVVTESAKLSVELQALTLRVESLAARVDFADKRVRGLEAAPPPRHSPRPRDEQPAAAASVPTASEGRGDSGTPSTPTEALSPDGQRRRRRRRRGRRNGGPIGDGSQPAPGQLTSSEGGGDEFDDGADDGAEIADDGNSDGEDSVTATPPTQLATEPAHRPLPTVERSAEPPLSASDAAASSTDGPDEPGSSGSPS